MIQCFFQGVFGASGLLLEYYSPVCMSAAASHLGLLDRVVSKAVRFSDGLVVCDLKHRRRVAALCMFYKIYCYPNHALEAALPGVCLPAILTRLVVSVHSRYLDVSRSRTLQLSRPFVPACARYWNSLDEPCFAGEDIADFKNQNSFAFFCLNCFFSFQYLSKCFPFSGC